MEENYTAYLSINNIDHNHFPALEEFNHAEVEIPPSISDI